jgi:hypothetical protein
MDGFFEFMGIILNLVSIPLNFMGVWTISWRFSLTFGGHFVEFREQLPFARSRAVLQNSCASTEFHGHSPQNPLVDSNSWAAISFAWGETRNSWVSTTSWVLFFA